MLKRDILKKIDELIEEQEAILSVGSNRHDSNYFWNADRVETLEEVKKLIEEMAPVFEPEGDLTKDRKSVAVLLGYLEDGLKSAFEYTKTPPRLKAHLKNLLFLVECQQAHMRAAESKEEKSK